MQLKHAPTEKTEKSHAQMHKKKDGSEITLLFSNNNWNAWAQMLSYNKIIISDNKSQHWGRWGCSRCGGAVVPWLYHI